MGMAALLTAFMQAIVRSGLNAMALLLCGVAAHLRLLAKSLALFTTSLDSLLQGLIWTLVINHTLYILVLLLLYLLCPSLLKFAFQVKEYLTLLLLEGLRLLLTPCFGDLPPLLYSALKFLIDILSGSTWLDLVFQYALCSDDAD